MIPECVLRLDLHEWKAEEEKVLQPDWVPGRATEVLCQVPIIHIAATAAWAGPEEFVAPGMAGRGGQVRPGSTGRGV